MKDFKSVFLASALVLIASGCAGRMPLVGLDGTERPILQRVAEDRYVDHLSTALVSIQDSMIPALDNTPMEQKWKLRTAVIGFGVNASAGIGPFKVGIKPRLRAAFATGEKPPIP
jgi:hypothetical protein